MPHSSLPLQFSIHRFTMSFSGVTSSGRTDNLKEHIIAEQTFKITFRNHLDLYYHHASLFACRAIIRSRSSVAGIALFYGLEDRGFESLYGRFFSSPKCPDRLWGPGLIFSGNRLSFLQLKRPEREGNNSPTSNEAVNNQWSLTSTRPVLLHGVDREIFTFHRP